MLTMFAYLMIMLCFGGFMVISLCIGLGDGDIPHDVIPADAPTDHDVGHGHGDKSMGGMLSGWLSMKVISAFGTAFGAAGAIAKANGMGDAAIWVAVGSAVVIAFLVRLLIIALRRSESNSSFTRQQVVGMDGVVTNAIVDGKTGEAQFNVAGENIALPVISKDGRSIPNGTQVVAVAAGAVMVVDRK